MMILNLGREDEESLEYICFKHEAFPTQVHYILCRCYFLHDSDSMPPLKVAERLSQW